MKKEKGKIIVFEGLDYSFKETNSKLLKDFLEKQGKKVELISFPNYDSDSSIFVKKHLNNDYGNASNVNPYTTSIFYALDRFDTNYVEQIKTKLDEGYIIIFDRYVDSNIAFQSAKISDIYDKIKYISWDWDLEYNKLGLPKPDHTIFLYMPVEVSHKLIKNREFKSGTDYDDYESNYKFKLKVEENMFTIANICKSTYSIINCTDIKDNILSANEIFNKVKFSLQGKNII